MIKALDRPDLAEDPRFASMGGRVEHRIIFMSILEEIFAEEPRDHWVEKLRTASVPCGPVRNLDEALNSPEVIEAGLVQTYTPSDGGRSTNAQSPIGLSDRPDREDTPPPLLGEHTDEVLRSILDLSEEESAKVERGYCVEDGTETLPEEIGAIRDSVNRFMESEVPRHGRDRGRRRARPGSTARYGRTKCCGVGR